MTEIQWTARRNRHGVLVPGETWNPWSGCVRVSRACRHCYAENAPPSMRRGAEWGPTAPRIHASEAYWKKPRTWQRKVQAEGERLRVFCSSMADVFEQHAVPEEQAKLDEARERLWRLIPETPNLDWLLLTKRPDAMAAWAHKYGWPSNALAGCTTEGQREFDERIEHLLRVPGRRFLSVEPMVEALDADPLWCPSHGRDHVVFCPPAQPWCTECDREVGLLGSLHEIDWVIIGGESGGCAALLDTDAAQALLDQCQRAGVATFVKQLGSAWARANGARHPKAGDPSEWPEALRVRQWYDDPGRVAEVQR